MADERPATEVKRPSRPGGDPLSRSTGSVLRALEGMVTSTSAANQEALKISLQIQDSAERTARMLGSVLDRAEVLMNRSGSGGGRSSVSMGSGVGAIARVGAIDEGGGGDGYGDSVGRTGIRPPAPGGRDVPEGGGRRKGLPDSWEEGKDYSLKDLRSEVASRAGEAIKDWGTSQKQVYRGEDGRYASRLVPKGSPRYADDFIGQGPGWRGTAVTGIKNATRALGGGASMGEAFGAMGAGAAKVAGVAGIAYTGINWGLNTAEDQRAKNAEYQSMIGGTNYDQWGERWDEMKFRWSMRGTMSGRDADAIYKGAAAQYGSNKNARGEFQDAAISMYRHSGMNSTESMQLLNMAVNSGNDSLNMLAASIRRLGTEAKKAGVSAKVAREYFTQSFQSIEGVANGGTQVLFSEIQAKSRMALGRSLGSSVDTSAQQTDLGTMINAQRAGITPAEYIAATMYGQTVNSPIYGMVDGAYLMARSESANTSAGVQAIDPSGAMRAFLAKRAKDKGWGPGAKGATQEELEDLAGEMSVKFPEAATPFRMGDLFRVAGRTDVPNNEAAGLFVNSVLNKDADPVAQLEQERQEWETPPKFDVDSEGWLKTVRSAKKKGEVPESKGPYGQAIKFIEDEIGIDITARNVGQLRSKGEKFNYSKNGKQGLQNALARQVAEGRTVNPAMLKVLENWDKFGTDDARLVVKTADGMKSVEMGEAAYLFGDQIRARPQDIKIQGGTFDGQNLNEALGIEGSGKNTDKELDDFKSADRDGVGISVEEGEERVEDSAKSGRVEVWIRPEFAHILGVTATGAAYATGNRAPANSDRTPPEQGN